MQWTIAHQNKERFWGLDKESKAKEKIAGTFLYINEMFECDADLSFLQDFLVFVQTAFCSEKTSKGFKVSIWKSLVTLAAWVSYNWMQKVILNEST